MARKVRTNALALANRLTSMIRKVTAGDDDPVLKDGVARLAAEMATAEVEIDAGVDEVSTRLAGEIGGSSIVQDPAWRSVVGAARGQKKNQ